MAGKVSNEDLALLVAAAKAAGLDPSKLKVMNPWEDDSPTARTLQAAVMLLDSAAGERLADEAGAELTLASANYLANGGELTQAMRGEIAGRLPSVAAKIRADELKALEDTFLANREQRYEQMAAVQEFQQSRRNDDYLKSLQLAQSALRGSSLSS